MIKSSVLFRVYENSFYFIFFNQRFVFVYENNLLNLQSKLSEEGCACCEMPIGFSFRLCALSLLWCSAEIMKTAKVLFAVMIMALAVAACRSAEYCNCG